MSGSVFKFNLPKNQRVCLYLTLAFVTAGWLSAAYVSFFSPILNENRHAFLASFVIGSSFYILFFGLFVYFNRIYGKALNELRISEERLNIAIEGSTHGLWDWNIATDEMYYAPRFRQLLGYDADDTENFPDHYTSFETVLHPDDEDETWQALINHIEDRIPYDVEHRLKHTSGAYKYFRCRGKAIRDEDGQVVRMAGSIVDISDRKRFEKELSEAKEAAVMAAEAKSAFLANMSHEIRTPMNGILGTAQLMSELPLNQKARKYLDIIRSSGKTLLEILNEILDFSKIEAGKFELHPAPMDMNKIIEEQTALLNPLAKEKGLNLKLDYDPAVPDYIIGDEVRIRQILTNLTGNALKFTDKGGITISVKPCEGEAHKILFTVKDTGIGLPEDRLEEIFGTFTQLQSATAQKAQGTGLGLAICKHLSEMMGGEIGVTSEEGKGSSFWFTIRYAEPNALDIMTLKDENFSKSAEIYFPDTYILVVEDVLTNQFVITDMLENMGCRVDIANHGKEAVRMVEETCYDLVFMDCQMPVMDGYEATETIRAHGFKHLPIVALTANALKGDKEKCLDAGMDAFLPKPINKEDIVSTLSFWLSSKEEKRGKVA